MRRTKPLTILFLLGCGVACSDHDTNGASAGLKGDDLRLVGVRLSLAGEHTRFIPLAPDGTPIAGGAVAVHRMRGRTLTTSNVVRPLVLRGRRIIGADEAGVRAVALVGGGTAIDVAAAALPETAGLARAGWRVVVVTAEAPRHEWEVWVDGERGDARVRRDLAPRVSGVGTVYLPNPVTATGSLTMVDDGDADSAELTSARAEVALQGLDGSGHLRGELVDVKNGTGRVQEPTLEFRYLRSEDGFEEVNAYYHIDRTQRLFQSLGFAGDRAILAGPFQLIANAHGADNSFYSPSYNRIELGTGGVDDGEDADVIIHEFGHAVLDHVVPGFGDSHLAASLGEGFGDLLAALVPTGGPDLVERACVAPWDAQAYTPAPPPIACMRRVDGQRHFPEHVHGEVHDDGEIWSGAMWDALDAAGLSENDRLALVLESLFLLAPDTSFAGSAAALLTADEALYDGVHSAALERALTWHGLLEEVAPAAPMVGPVASFSADVESAHPLDNTLDETATLTHAGATAIRVHFASFNMESDPDCYESHCDRVYLYDGTGRLYAKLGGAMGAFAAPAVPGDTVIVRWVTDGTIASTGFAIDGYDVTGVTAGADAAPSDAAIPDARIDGRTTEPPDADPGEEPDGGLVVQRDAGPDGAPTGALDAGARPRGKDGGCGCRVSRQGGRTALGLLLLFVAGPGLLLRRRRCG